MYTATFGLRCAPFEDRADVAFFFPAASHEEAMAAMQYEAQHGEGVGLVLGETGTGKTTLMRALSRRLSDSGKVAVLTVPGNGVVDILREACKAFGVSLPSSLQDARGLARLRRHLVRNGGKCSCPTLIIDQAEHLSPGDLTDIESLLELQDDRGRLLRVVLAAHVRFHVLLSQPAFTRLRQLAFTEHRLGGLSEPEVAQYIRHRLNVAGAAGTEIFSADAIAKIHERSSGIPRVINQLCNAAMLSAFGARAMRVTSEHIEGPSHTFESDSIPSTSVSRTWDVFEDLPATDAAQRFQAESWNEQSGQHDKMGSAVADQLAGLIQQAERVMNSLHRRELQTAAAVGHSERKIEQALDSTRDRFIALESKLSTATRRAEQAASQMERAEQVFVRAEQLETRLAAFADQLAEQMDNVEARVAEIMNHATPLDEARKGLEDAVRQSEAARGKIERASSWADALLLEQREKFATELRKAVSSSMETAAKKITETADKAQGKIDTSARLATEQISHVETATTQMHDAVQTGRRAIQEASQKAHRTGEELGQIIDLAKQEIAGGQQAAERICALHRESAQVAARVAADTAAARGVCEDISGLISSADAKIGQLASTHAASNHLHERLAKLVVSGHPVAERAEEAVEQLRVQLRDSDKAQSQLADKIVEATSKLAAVAVQLDRVGQSAADAEKRSQNLQDALRNAGEIQHELETTGRKASVDIISLQESIGRSSELVGRAESINHTLEETIQGSTALAAMVASANSITQEIHVLLEAASDCETSLSEKSEAMKDLIDFHEKVRHDAADATQRMAEYLQSFHETLHKSEGQIQEHQHRMDALEQEFRQVTERAGTAQEVATKVQTVVDNAQAQSENLERVCIAVRKVFSGLSQASLNARNQTGELERFIKQASQTASTIQQWLEQVRVRVEHVTEVQLPRLDAVVARRVEAPTGTMDREAEMLVEDDPGVENAHLGGGRLEDALVPPHFSKAREIELLIEKARQSKTAMESELEMVGRAGD